MHPGSKPGSKHFSKLLTSNSQIVVLVAVELQQHITNTLHRACLRSLPEEVVQAAPLALHLEGSICCAQSSAPVFLIVDPKLQSLVVTKLAAVVGNQTAILH